MGRTVLYITYNSLNYRILNQTINFQYLKSVSELEAAVSAWRRIGLRERLEFIKNLVIVI